MSKYKILFPTGYQLKDVSNDNLDIHVVTDDRVVFFGTLFTIANIQSLMKSWGSSYFWATDMVVLIDLEKETIKKSISQLIADGYLERAFSKIGNVKDIYPDYDSFERL